MCHAEDAQRAEFFLKESRLGGKGTGMRGLQGRTVCACARFPCGEPSRKSAAVVWAAGAHCAPLRPKEALRVGRVTAPRRGGLR